MYQLRRIGSTRILANYRGNLCRTLSYRIAPNVSHNLHRLRPGSAIRAEWDVLPGNGGKSRGEMRLVAVNATDPMVVRGKRGETDKVCRWGDIWRYAVSTGSVRVGQEVRAFSWNGAISSSFSPSGSTVVIEISEMQELFGCMHSSQGLGFACSERQQSDIKSRSGSHPVHKSNPSDHHKWIAARIR